MSVIKPGVTSLHHFFRSGPMPCPYLSGRIERKLFTRLSGPDAEALNSTLSQAGFRRSHDIIYRPVCPDCRACVPVRIPVSRFSPGRTMRRTRRANADLSMTERPPRASLEQFHMFQQYQQSRHGDSDMARMSRADYAAMIEEGSVASTLQEFRAPSGALVGAMLSDRLADGYSAVYSFFDPSLPERSLGTYMVMALVDEATAQGLPHVYLGYWIAGSRKMSYKTRFRPLEALTDEGWRELSDAPPASRG
ncbi:MAG: arginyltransferase [Inquilinus sp.]|nr:arginyltransferase [Inquilinus sp.]